MRRRISCIRQESSRERYERISRIGGDWGNMKIEDAIWTIEKTSDSFYVKVGYEESDVIVVTHQNGRKYLRTKADTTTVDNLLSLPECPY